MVKTANKNATVKIVQRAILLQDIVFAKLDIQD